MTTTDDRPNRFGWDEEVVVLAGADRSGVLERVREIHAHVSANPDLRLTDLASKLSCPLPQGASRLALVSSSLDDLTAKLEHVTERLSDPERQRINDPSGIYWFERPLDGSVALLFPGEGSQYVGMLRELALHVPHVLAWLDEVERALAGRGREYRFADVLFGAPTVPEGVADRLLQQMDWGSEAAFVGGYAYLGLIERLGLDVGAVCGHSSGEYTALVAAGALQMPRGDELMERYVALNALFEEEAQEGRIPSGTLLAVGGVDREAIVAATSDDVVVAMDNCPHQVVLCGDEQSIASADERLRELGAMTALLPIDRAYHTAAFDSFCDRLRRFFAGLPIVEPTTTIYSAVTAAPFPQDVEELRDLASRQYARPVRFRETIEAMYADGVRLFVEVGARSNLTGFVRDTLRGKPHLAVPVDAPHRSSTASLCHLAASIIAHGRDLDLRLMFRGRTTEGFELDDTGPTAPPAPELAVSLPRLELSGPPPTRSPAVIQAGADAPGKAGDGATTASAGDGATTASKTAASAHGAATTAPETTGDTVSMNAYFETMEQFLATQQRVMTAYLGSPAAPPQPRPVGFGAVPTVGHPTTIDPPTAIEAIPGVEAAVEPVPTPPAVPERDLEAQIQAIVSDRTGYPVDMLDPSVNLEADLGIDSIKRVEILGAIQHETGLLTNPDELEQASELRTIAEIVGLIGADSEAEPPAKPPMLPLIGDVVSHGGNELTVHRRLDPTEDLFLLHHTIGGTVSDDDTQLTALAVMPFTMTIEMLAEAASLLVPGKIVVGLRDVHQDRWIGFDDGPVDISMSATVLEGGEATEVRVEARSSAFAANEVFAGAVVRLADEVSPTMPASLRLPELEASTWSTDRLYRDGMFTGPAFRSVTSMDRVGHNAAEGALAVLPVDGLFRSSSPDRLATDPVVLDGAGQVVGFWAAERLEAGFVVFPVAASEIELLGRPLAVGDRAVCRALITSEDDTRLVSDIEVTDSTGSVRARVNGWEDRRLDVPRSFAEFVLDPLEAMLSEEWPAAASCISESGSWVARRVEHAAPPLPESAWSFWQRVVVSLVLSREERKAWTRQPPTAERTAWLLGRIAAKDAVRQHLREQHDLRVRPADVEIEDLQSGELLVGGTWLEQVGRAPSLSVAHTAGVAVAVVGDHDGPLGVGLAIRKVGEEASDLDRSALAANERDAVPNGDSTDQHEWILRAVCAKEAASRALAPEPPSGLGLTIEDLDAVTGIARLTLATDLGPPLRLPAGLDLFVRTERDDEYVLAGSVVSVEERV